MTTSINESLSVRRTYPDTILIVKLAKTEEELENIYKFRYQVGVEKYGLKQRYKDEDKKIVKEPLDEGANLFYAEKGGEIIGTVRAHYPPCSSIDFYTDLYGIHDLMSTAPHEIAIGSKLLVDKNNKYATHCTYKLLQYQYEYSISKKRSIAFVDCEHKSKLNVFYQKLGFVTHKIKALHPDTGIVNVYRLDMNDIAHLERMKSPFRKSFYKTNGRN